MHALAAFIITALWCLALMLGSNWTKWIEYVQKRVRGIRFLVDGPRIIDEGYAKASKMPFKVSTPSNDLLMVTSDELIAELLAAPKESLSLHAVAKEILQPKFTMQGFEWSDQRGVEGTGFVRALRSLLTSHLPRFQPDLDRIIRGALHMEINGVEKNGSSSVRLFPMVKRIVTKVNCFAFFGEELSKNAEFTAAALEFPQTVIMAAEALRVVPSFLRPLVAMVVTRRHRAARTLFCHLRPIVEARLTLRAGLGDINKQSKVPADCMQWLIDTSPRKDPWTPDRMVGEIVAVWFSSVHQLAMTTTQVIQDICLHREYMEPLETEITRLVSRGSTATLNVDDLPLLDSFVKESVRCSNADAVSCRRKALAPFVFSDGSRVETGDWVCIPQRSMMQDAQRYSDPLRFDGFRFAKANELLRIGGTTDLVPDRVPPTMTTASAEWPIWGLGATACPGRFYAALVLKLMVSQLLTEWDLHMIEGSRTDFTWRSSIVPRDSNVVTFRRKPLSL